MTIETFSSADLENVLSRMQPSEIDRLPFGAVQVDRTGKVLFYNAAEGEITGRDPQSVLGKNFFREIAPCTRTPRFEGVFQAGVKDGVLDATFDYIFDYKMKPTEVRVTMKKAIVGDSYWILVKRIGRE